MSGKRPNAQTIAAMEEARRLEQWRAAYDDVTDKSEPITNELILVTFSRALARSEDLVDRLRKALASVRKDLVGSRLDSAVERVDAALSDRPTGHPGPSVSDLLAKFDPELHRRHPMLDDGAVGTETPP